MPPLNAFVFDLYGTLLSSPPATLHREIPRVLEVPARAWLTLVRDKLLVMPFANAEELAHFICEELAPGYGGEREARCVEIITDQLRHVGPLPGTVSLLSFLKRRGYRLGLLSNLSSSYKQPLEESELSPLFDARFYSCDEGAKKPNPDVYRTICDRLGVEPERAIFIGDSLKLDVEGPRQIGMHALQVGEAGDSAVEETHLLGLMDFSGSAPRPMLEVGSTITLDGTRLTAKRIVPVSDDEQGRYNLVYRVETDDSTFPAVFVKRFLFPESAHVEELAYNVHRIVGLPTCHAAIHDDGEPLLVMSAANGSKYEDEMSEDIAWEIGRHFAFAYVFSNADIRPRNAFINTVTERPELTMVDLEHCFFNLAIDVSDLERPLDPRYLDALDDLRVAKTVLTDRAMRRARRSFVHEESIRPEIYTAYQSGFRDCFHSMHERRSAVTEFLADRVGREPYLVIGTHSYRRAMAMVDVREIADRLNHDPDQVMTRFC
jgi:HAD superfamily hydrolase (TIGR01509 family)